MKRLRNEEIIAGERVGKIFLGMSLKEFETIFGNENDVINLETCKTILFDNAKFWFDLENKLFQIMVFGDFGGKFKKAIGIGDTLSQVEKCIGGYEQVHDTYTLKGYNGICFELEDTENWSEQKSPIESISIY